MTKIVLFLSILSLTQSSLAAQVTSVAPTMQIQLCRAVTLLIGVLDNPFLPNRPQTVGMLTDLGQKVAATASVEVGSPISFDPNAENLYRSISEDVQLRRATVTNFGGPTIQIQATLAGLCPYLTSADPKTSEIHEAAQKLVDDLLAGQ